ncbi:MAG: DUF86 domain-containing protein [Halarsenatibacteraceae bacterium]
MTEQKLIRRKLSKLIQSLNELAEIEEYSLEEYLQNFFISRTTERLIQLIVETATDINGHLIIEAGRKPPETYYDSFIILGRLNIISAELAEELAPSAGLRNRIVHEYDEIIDKIVYESIADALKLYKQYVREIENYCFKE